MLAWLLTVKHYSVTSSLLIVALLSVLIGLSHGLLITKLRLQPFVVTLCGLLIYRGMARYLTNDETLGFGVIIGRCAISRSGIRFRFRFQEGRCWCRCPSC